MSNSDIELIEELHQEHLSKVNEEESKLNEGGIYDMD